MIMVFAAACAAKTGDSNCKTRGSAHAEREGG